MPKSEFKVIAMNARDQDGTAFEKVLNDAGTEGWELVSTPSTSEAIYAVLRRERLLHRDLSG
jgi:hypothetical protein